MVRPVPARRVEIEEWAMLKLTEAQYRALEKIEGWIVNRKTPFNMGEARITLAAVREDVLCKLLDKGLIDSKQPSARVFYSVTLTDEGRKALAEWKQRRSKA